MTCTCCQHGFVQADKPGYNASLSGTRLVWEHKMVMNRRNFALNNALTIASFPSNALTAVPGLRFVDDAR